MSYVYKKYSPEYYIAKFEKIPADKWTTFYFNYKGKKCALGHCGRENSLADTEESNELEELLPDIYLINDGVSTRPPIVRELGDNPRDRVINALVLVACGLYEEHVYDK